MSAIKIINLIDLIDEAGEDFAKEILSSFSCPLNLEIQKFLREDAIDFAKKQIAVTYLAFAEYNGQQVLVGYYTLALKMINISKANFPSRSLWDRVKKFATCNSNESQCEIVAPLIAQLGKNYTDVYADLISGDDLLSYACEKVAAIQHDIGGKVVYLECEDKPALVRFYALNGFRKFGERLRGKDEPDLEGKRLLQMIKYSPTY